MISSDVRAKRFVYFFVDNFSDHVLNNVLNSERNICMKLKADL